jgi:hypothetical protein
MFLPLNLTPPGLPNALLPDIAPWLRKVVYLVAIPLFLRFLVNILLYYEILVDSSIAADVFN